jgi:hypothetical protein
VLVETRGEFRTGLLRALAAGTDDGVRATERKGLNA